MPVTNTTNIMNFNFSQQCNLFEEFQLFFGRRNNESFAILTQEEEDEVTDYMKLAKSLDSDSASARLFCGHFLQAGSFLRLMPRIWLNDEIINHFVISLVRSAGNNERIFGFTSFFISSFMSDRKNTARWHKTLKTFEMDIIVVPVNISNSHWTLVVVYVPLKRIRYLCSTGGSGEKYTAAILEWLELEANKFSIPFSKGDWDVSFNNSGDPWQDNGKDCGLYVIHAIECVVNYMPIAKRRANDMLIYRKRLALRIIAAIKSGIVLQEKNIPNLEDSDIITDNAVMSDDGNITTTEDNDLIFADATEVDMAVKVKIEPATDEDRNPYDTENTDDNSDKYDEDNEDGES